MELTSRVSTDEVAQAKQRLEAVFGRDADPVDVALATNMISVGLDITRLGLMVVQGQPKTAAEYIQATSRVGRDHDRPGLVRRRAQPAQAARPDALRAVRPLPPHLLPRRRGDERHALGGPRAGPGAGGRRRRGGAPRRSEPDAGCRGQGAEEPAGDPRRPSAMPSSRARRRALSPAGSAALAALVDGLLDAWIATADEQAAGGNAFAYAQQEKPASAAAHAARTGDRKPERGASRASWRAARCATSSRAWR